MKTILQRDITFYFAENANAQKYNFAFNTVFNQDATQSDVFNKITPLLQSAIDGRSGCMCLPLELRQLFRLISVQR